MQKKMILIFMILTSLVLMACRFSAFSTQNIKPQPTISQPASPTPQKAEPTSLPTSTIDPLVSAKSCLARTWRIDGLAEYVIAAIPPELAEEYNLEYVSTRGAVYLSLTPDEKIILQANELVFLFNAQFSIFKVSVTVNIDGSATGIYTADPTTLTIKDMDTRGLRASAQAMNEELIDSQQIINAIPFTRPPFNTAAYTCQGEMLELTLSGYPDVLPPLVLQAVK